MKSCGQPDGHFACIISQSQDGAMRLQFPEAELILVYIFTQI